MDRDEVLKARDASGLEIPACAIPCILAKQLTDPNPRRGRLAWRDSRRRCAMQGVWWSSVLLVPGSVNKHVSYAEAYTRSQAEIRKGGAAGGGVGREDRD